MHLHFLFTSLLALALPLALCGCSSHSAEPPAWPPFTAQSATNAWQYVSDLVQISPRDSGTAEAAYASQWIAQSLRKAGLEPHADVWRERSGDRDNIQFCNIYADLPGQTNSLLVVGSHFDTKANLGPRFQGANDGGSSTGILLEAARILTASGIRPKHTIRFAFFDGEECFTSYSPSDGLHGSRRMARQLAENRAEQEIDGVVVIDMVGDQYLQLQLPRNVTPWMASLVLASSVNLDRRLGGSSGAIVRIANTYVIDDHWPFIEKNIPAVNIIDFDYGSEPGRHDYWHTEEDTLDKVFPSSLGTVGQLLLDILEKLDERELAPSARD